MFGSFMADVEDDPIFGSHMRHIRQMNGMMNSLFADPFGMFGGGGPLAIGGPRAGSALMPFMPQMPSLNRLFSADLENGMGGMGGMGTGSSFSSSTIMMSSGPHGKPQVISTSSSTRIGPHGIKETKKTLQDSRTGTKKLSIGHHIGDRAHLIEREQNVYSGDAEEHQEFINLEEEEAEDFDREFQHKAGAYMATSRGRIRDVPRRASPPPAQQRLAIMPAPSATATSTNERRAHSRHTPRRHLHTSSSPLAVNSSNVRSMYGGPHPQRQRHKHRPRRASPAPPAPPAADH